MHPVQQGLWTARQFLLAYSVLFWNPAPPSSLRQQILYTGLDDAVEMEEPLLSPIPALTFKNMLYKG